MLFKALPFGEGWEGYYSDLKLFTGLALAVFIALNPTDSKAMIKASAPAKANIHQWICIR
jgi:hypothetical protein